MASWSTRRKYGSFAVFIAVVAIIFGLPSLFLFYKAPTCFDGKQNARETGIDCGGSCTRLCPADFAAPRVLWQYSAKVLPGIYNALAYIQNPNNSVQAKQLEYIFKLYDDKGLLVAQRTGNAYVPAGQRFAVFEGGIDTGNRIPSRTTFEFTGVPDWTPGSMLTKIRTLNTALDEGNKPSAQVDIQNDSVDQSFSNIDAFIILYDQNDNRISFSKTVIETLAAGEKATLFFTWPEALSAKVVRTEVIFVARSAH